MDRNEALRLLGAGREGVTEWNRRRETGDELPSLSWADLSRADLGGATLNMANLSGGQLSGANLSQASLVMVNLNEAKLCRANLSGATLSQVFSHDPVVGRASAITGSSGSPLFDISPSAGQETRTQLAEHQTDEWLERASFPLGFLDGDSWFEAWRVTT